MPVSDILTGYGYTLFDGERPSRRAMVETG